jgi:hypothetical protein
MSEATAAPVAAPAAVEAPAAPAPAPEVEAPEVEGAGQEAPQDASKGGAVRGPDGKFVKADGSPKEAAPPGPKKFKVKVHGEEQEVDEEELLRGYQLKQASNKRFEEASKKERDATEKMEKVGRLLQTLSSDPKAFAAAARDLNLTKEQLLALGDALLEPIISEQVEAEKLAKASPEQKRLMELEKENAALKAEHEKRKAQEEADKRKSEESAKAERVKSHRQSFEGQVMEAMEALKLPKSHALAKEVLDVISDAMENQVELTTRDIVAEVRERKLAEHKALLEALDDAALDDFVPKTAQEKLRKKAVEKLKASNPMLTAAPAVSKSPRAGDRPVTSETRRSMESIARDLSLGKFTLPGR